jgi:hypothetical protein
MYDPFEIEMPHLPILSFQGVPKEQLIIARSVFSNLSGLESAALAFYHAVFLFSFSMQRLPDPKMRGWAQLAGREGAMTLRNYRTFLETVKRAAGRVSLWRNKLHLTAIKDIEKDFLERFPFAVHQRHAVAHPENYADPAKNIGFSGNFDGLGMRIQNSKNISIQSGISDDVFFGTWEGRIVQYPLNKDSTVFLYENLSRVFDIFRPLETN